MTEDNNKQLWTTEEVKYMLDDAMSGLINAIEEDRRHTQQQELHYSTKLEYMVKNLEQAREDIKTDSMLGPIELKWTGDNWHEIYQKLFAPNFTIPNDFLQYSQDPDKNIKITTKQDETIVVRPGDTIVIEQGKISVKGT